MSHMWYMPMILGLYLWVPLMAKVVRTSNIKYLEALSGLTFAIFFCLPMINGILYLAGIETLNSYIDMGCSGGIYGLMLVLGYYVKKGEFDFVPTPFLTLTGITCFSLTVYQQFFFNVRGIDCAVWYNSPSLVVCSLVIFILFDRLKPKRNKFIEQVSKMSFGIYLIHNMVLKVLLKYLSYDASIQKIGIMLFLTLFITYFIAHMISQYKLAKYLILTK